MLAAGLHLTPQMISWCDSTPYARNSTMADTAQTIIDLNQRLLNSIVQADWNAYADTVRCDADCFEPEGAGPFVEGMPFHRFYFDLGASKGPCMSRWRRRMCGCSAIGRGDLLCAAGAEARRQQQPGDRARRRDPACGRRSTVNGSTYTSTACHWRSTPVTVKVVNRRQLGNARTAANCR